MHLFDDHNVLLKALQKGEEKAFEYIFNHYYDGLLNSWNIFFSKFADQNLLLQFLLELCNASNVDASVFGEKVLLSTYYSFSYEDEILLVFTNDGSGNVTTTDTTIILYYDTFR